MWEQSTCSDAGEYAHEEAVQCPCLLLNWGCPCEPSIQVSRSAWTVLQLYHVADTQQGLTSAALRRPARGLRRSSPGSFRVCALDAAALDGMYAAAIVAQHNIPTGTHLATQMLSSSHGHSVSLLYTLGDAAVSQASAVQVRGTPKVPGCHSREVP